MRIPGGPGRAQRDMRLPSRPGRVRLAVLAEWGRPGVCRRTGAHDKWFHTAFHHSNVSQANRRELAQKQPDRSPAKARVPQLIGFWAASGDEWAGQRLTGCSESREGLDTRLNAIWLLEAGFKR